MQSDNCHSADHSYPDLGLYSPYFQSVQKSAMFLLFLNIAEREAALVYEQATLRSQASEQAAAARDELEARCAARRRELADELGAALAALFIDMR